MPEPSHRSAAMLDTGKRTSPHGDPMLDELRHLDDDHDGPICEVCEQSGPTVRAHLCNQGTDDEEVLDFCDECLEALTNGPTPWTNEHGAMTAEAWAAVDGGRP